jgi:mono/diheme cytochrome c family protein
MPAWGVKSGKGALNEQSIQDLVNYLYSISTTPEKAQAGATKEAEDMRKSFESDEVRAAAAKWVADTTAALAQARADLAALPIDAGAQPRSNANDAVEVAAEQAAAALDWQRTTQSATDGEILFMGNCARCHTRGWSYFDPTDPNPEGTDGTVAPGPMGGGAYGPNLTGGDVNNQFPPPGGESELFEWISAGVPANAQYGIRGISSGRMPHFGATLTKEQIEAIMAYERSL